MGDVQPHVNRTAPFSLSYSDNPLNGRYLCRRQVVSRRVPRGHRAAMTIVELVVAVTLLTLVVGATVPIFTHTRRTWDTWQNSSEAIQNGRVLIDHMHRNLAEATKITTVSDAAESSGYIEFQDNNSTTLRYQIGTSNYVEFGEVGSLATLAGPVSNLKFTCYADNDLSTAITDVNAIRYVKVESTVTNAAAEGVNRVFSTSAYLRTNGLTTGSDDFTAGTPLEFDIGNGEDPAIAQIDSTHYLCAYEGSDGDAWAVVLTVNSSTWTVTKGTPLEFDSSSGQYPSLAQIDSTHYLCTYEGSDDDGWAVILTVDTDTWTLTSSNAFEFDTNNGETPSVTQIDSTHYLCAYEGGSDDGWAVVLTVEGGLLGHWKLDETSGTTAADSSDNSNDGTLTYMSGSEWTSGQRAGALEFAGSADHIVIANDTSLQPTSALTIAAWIKGDSWGSDEQVDAILRKGQTTPCNYQLSIADQKLSLHLDDYDEDDGFRGDTSLSTGQWYHVAGTWDGSNVRIYVNGVLDNDPPDSRTGTIGTDTRPLYIGGRPGDDYFDGIIDDVRLYNTALTAAEIAQLTAVLSFQEYTETKAGSDTTSVTLNTPAGTDTGDLLICAVATDGDTDGSLAPPGGEGWTEITLNGASSEMTLGTWWKLAGSSESSTHQFTWSDSEQAYGWMMRFSGHDSSDPIDASATDFGTSSSPSSPSVTSTVDNALILRLGGFDDGDVTLDAPGLSGHTAITMDASASNQVTFRGFSEKKVSSNNDSVTVNTPSGTSTGDLLITAVVVDSEEMEDLAPPGGQGWNEIYLNDYDEDVTLGVWWKLAGASEPSSHQFTWDDDQEAYAWMMRFTGHHATSPIHDWDARRSSSSSPDCDAVTTTVANCMILRIGGFDDDDVTVDSSGLSGHTTITMDESSSGDGTCSGGAGYEQQATPGESNTPEFSLTGSEEYVTVSVAIAPSTGGGSGGVSGGAGYVKQASSGSSGTSNFSLTASEEARMVTIAVAPDPNEVTVSGGYTISKETAYEFDTSKGKEPALAQIDSTHYLCAYRGNSDDGWATILIVNTSTWNITEGTPLEFETSDCEDPALIQIDSTHYLCAYEGPDDDGWAVVLTVNTSSWTISAGTPFEFDTDKGKTPALSKIDSNRYLCAYAGPDYDGWAVVLAVNTSNWTISKETPLEYDTSQGKAPTLQRIDDGHHLCAYEGSSDDGWAIVLMPSTNTIMP